MSESNRKLAYALVASAIDAHWPSMVINGTGRDEVLVEVGKIRDGLRAASEVPLSPTGKAELAATPVVGCDECGAQLNDQDVCTADPAHRQDGDGYLFSDGTDVFSRLMAATLADLRRGLGSEGVVDADEVERLFQAKVASGEVDLAQLREAFDQRFPPKAGHQPLVTYPDWPKCPYPAGSLGHEEFLRQHGPGAGSDVRPERDRPEQEEADRGPPPPPTGQGPAAEEGPSPAPLTVILIEPGSICDEVVGWLNADRPARPEEQLRAYQDHLHDCASCDGVADLRALGELARQGAGGPVRP